MSRLFRFPFRFGSVPAPASATSTPAEIAAASRWATISGAAATWQARGAGIRQFHRIHTQPVLTFGQSVNFAFRVNDAFPLKVKDNGDHIHVASTITSP